MKQFLMASTPVTSCTPCADFRKVQEPRVLPVRTRA